jgi:hypothetical protein
MKSLRNSVVALFCFAGLATAAMASPVTSYDINLTFVNGATFTGVVDFNSSLTQITSLTGTLKDYQDGTLGYDKLGTTDTLSLTGGGLRIGPTLDNVTVGDSPWTANIGSKKSPIDVAEENVLTLDFNLSNPNDISMFDVVLQTGVDHQLSGDIVSSESDLIAVTATPEPGSYLLLGTGLAALAFFVRRKGSLLA